LCIDAVWNEMVMKGKGALQGLFLFLAESLESCYFVRVE
jgi:hypothetical protein